MSKIKQQDKSFELTYLVIHVEDDLQAELDAIKQIEPKYRPTKDRIIEEWVLEYVSDFGSKCLAKHYLLKSSDTQDKESVDKGKSELEKSYKWLLHLPKIRNRRRISSLMNKHTNNIGQWLEVVRDYENPKKQVCTPESESYYTVIPSVLECSRKTRKLIKEGTS